MNISAGFSQAERQAVATLYWGAFGGKLGRALGPDARAIAFLSDIADPAHALCARSETGDLLGVAGFKTFEGALVDGGWSDLVRHYGVMGSAWRAGLLALLERDTDNDRFLMDGIFVAPEARGRGVGTALLNAIYAQARARDYAAVRLDVIDTNPRARALYEREGFEAVGEAHLGPLRHVFGFRTATTMVKQL